MEKEINYPKVSIITLNYNGLKDTIECLESLKKITYLNYDVIVVDNASRENDVEILREEFGDYIHIIKNDKNYGFAEGNNIGIRHALGRRTDYILLLNNDTTVAPDFLDELIKVAQGDTEVGIAGPKSYHYEEPQRLGCTGGFISYWTGSIRHLGTGQIDQGQLEQITNVDYITGTCMLISRKALLSVGLLDNRFFFGSEDIDISIRASRRGFRIIFAAKSKIWHKGESRSRMRVTETRRKLYGYYVIRNRLSLMEKHWNRAQLAVSILCLVARSPLLLFTYLRYYHSMDMLTSFMRGLWDYLKRR